MAYAILDNYRVRTGLPWLPGGVAVVSPPGLSRVRYTADEIAQPAAARFRAEVELIDKSIASEDVDPWEIISRAIRSGFSGYLSWQVAIEIDTGLNLNRLFEHYVVSGAQSLPSGARPLEVLELPLG